MRQSRESFWVGLFVLVGLAALGVLVVMFGRTGIGLRQVTGYSLNIRFDRAPGIRPGSIVTLGGIPVGRVSAVDFFNPQKFEEGVLVSVIFDKPEYRFNEGTAARTNEPGLGEGRPPIVIIPGPSGAPLLESGSFIRGTISSAMESLIPPEIVNNFDRARQKIEDAAAALTPVLNDLHLILQPRQVAEVDAAGGPPGNLSSAVQRLDAGLKHFNEVLGDPEVKSQLRSAIANFHGMTEDGKVMVTEMKQAATDARATVEGAKGLIQTTTEAVSRIDGNVDRVSRTLISNLEIASSALTNLNAMLERAERGEGTVGLMFRDNRLYEAMLLTFRRLAETTEEFRTLVKDWQKGKVRVAF